MHGGMVRGVFMFLPRAVGGDKSGPPVPSVPWATSSTPSTFPRLAASTASMVSILARPTESGDPFPPKNQHLPSQCCCEVFIRSDRNGPQADLC